jgi:hypothetical protein
MKTNISVLYRHEYLDNGMDLAGIDREGGVKQCPGFSSLFGLCTRVGLGI